jgi:autotransporter-associated beta strand protein
MSPAKPPGTGFALLTKRTGVVIAAILCAATSPLPASVTAKGGSGLLSSKQSWIGNRVPGSADIALWDSTASGATTASLGANLSWLGIQIINPGGAVTINSGSTLTLGSSGINMSGATQNLTLNCAVMLGAAQTWDVTTGRTISVGGVIGGSGALTKNGAGTLSLTGLNTYTGSTTVNGGVVQINSASSLGSTTGAATINAATVELIAAKTVSTTRAFKLGNAASTLQVDTGSSWTISGAISNATAAGSLIKTGAGTLVLSSASGNSYGGAGRTTSINGGTIQVGADNLLGNSANTVTFNGGTLLFSAGFTTARSISMSGSGTINTNNNAATLSGVLSGSGALTKSGAGTLTLSGSNTYSGGTTITGGNTSVVSANSAANLGTGTININGGAGLLATASFTYGNGIVLGATGGSTQGDGTLESGMLNVAGGVTLVLSGTGISEVTSGTGRLEKLGAGTLVVNTANTYSGGTYIHDGTFIFGDAAALGPQPSNNPTFNQLTIDNGAQLQLSVSGAFRRNVIIGTGGAVFGATTSANVAYRNGVFSNVTAQTGGVTIASGVNGFGGANTFTGNLIVNGGAVAAISRDVNLGASGNQISLNGGTLRVEDGVDITGNGGTTTSTILATFATSRQINLGAGTDTIEVKNYADTNPSFDVTTSNPIVPSGGRPNSHTNIFTSNGLLTGAGTLVKAGDGTLTLTNLGNNYTGGTVINAGTLSVADPAAIGAAANALTINAGGVFQSTGTFSSARAITLGGTGGLSSGGTFDVTGTNVETQSGVVSGTGSLSKTGSGTLNMSGANTYTGDTFVLGGTIAVTGSQSLGPQPPSLGARSMRSTSQAGQRSKRL